MLIRSTCIYLCQLSPPQVNTGYLLNSFADGYTVPLGWFYPIWSVTDGIYNGPSPLSVSPYIEKIDHNASSLNAVRVWQNERRNFICYDLSGAAFTPTGIAGQGNTNLVELDDFTFEFPPVLNNVVGTQDIYNRSSGEKVELVRGLWSYNSLSLNYDCGRFIWSELENGYQGQNQRWRLCTYNI